jgi:hypothetical protein
MRLKGEDFEESRDSQKQKHKSRTTSRFSSKVTRSKRKFTAKLRMLIRRPSPRKLGKTTIHQTRLDLYHNTTSEKIASPILKSKSSIMDRMRDFWKPSHASNSRAETSDSSKGHSRVEKGRSRIQNANNNGISSDLNGTYSRSSRNNPQTTLNSSKLALGEEYSFATVDSTDGQPPSALDCPHTKNARRIEQQTQEMIMSSLSTVDENLDEETTKSSRKKKGWDWNCTGKSKAAPGKDETGQGAGNTDIPPDADLLTTYTESDESLIHVEIESPVIDDSLLRRKTYDLRELDAILLQQSQILAADNTLDAILLQQSQQLKANSSNIRIPSAEQDQHIRSKKVIDSMDDIDEELYEPEDMSFVMDDEISGLEIPGPNHPGLCQQQRETLASRPRYFPKLNTVAQAPVLTSQGPNNLVREQKAKVEQISEKVLDLSLDDNETVICVYYETEGKAEALVKMKDKSKDVRTIPWPAANTINKNAVLQKVDAGQVLKVAIDDKYFVPSLNDRPTAKPERDMDAKSIEPLETSYVKVAKNDSLGCTCNPAYICAAHPSLDNYEDESQPSSSTVGKYPALDSSATSLEFGFRPTLEGMAGSWPNESEYVTDFDVDGAPEVEAKNVRTWRDYSIADLPMGRADTYLQYVRHGKTQKACGAGHGRESTDSVCSACSVKAH